MSKPVPGSPVSQSGWLLCRVAVFSRSFTRRLAVIFEHGIVHGITAYTKNKPLILNYKNGSFTIKWECPALAGNVWHLQVSNQSLGCIKFMMY
jgi:hypothetical protein